MTMKILSEWLGEPLGARRWSRGALARVVAIVWIAGTFQSVIGAKTSAWADEAPTILIEDVVLGCSVPAASRSMPNVAPPAAVNPAIERSVHRLVAELCQGADVCRIEAQMVIEALPPALPCSELVVVPVCAGTAPMPYDEMVSSELALRLEPGAQLVINCGDRPSPHF
ncbi:MAG: hypothetical protein AAFQ42_14350 [Pseudomonadota bacterium]